MECCTAGNACGVRYPVQDFMIRELRDDSALVNNTKAPHNDCRNARKVIAPYAVKPVPTPSVADGSHPPWPTDRRFMDDGASRPTPPTPRGAPHGRRNEEETHLFRRRHGHHRPRPHRSRRNACLGTTRPLTYSANTTRGPHDRRNEEEKHLSRRRHRHHRPPPVAEGTHA